MTPRPFHRWKSFWLGLLVLVFLGWAWVRSARYTDGIGYSGKSSPSVWSAYNHRGTLQFLSVWTGRGVGTGSIDVMSQPHDLPPSGSAMWPASPVSYERRLLGDTGKLAQVTLAHWFLILLFLVPWTGFLVWRVRRVKRLGGPSSGAGD